MQKNSVRPNDNDQQLIRFGVTVVIVVFCILGSWMAIAPLSSAIVATGSVSADIYKKTVQHLEGGIVEEILVRNGDTVHEGQVLLKFQNSSVSSQLHILENQYREALVVESRLESQINALSEITFSDELLAQEQTSELNNTLRTQKQIFDLKQKMIINDARITEQRITQLTRYVEGMNALLQSKFIRLQAINEEIEEWKILLAEQLIDKLKIRELMKEKAMIEGDISNSQSEIAKAKEQMNELQSQFLARQKEIQDKTFEELVATKNLLAEIRSKRVALKDTSERLSVKAPISGVVVGLEIHTIGGVITAGKPIMDIVPYNEHLMIYAKIQTNDVDKVHPNQLADIRFSAFNTKYTNVLEAKVVHVSADSLIDQRTGTPYYEVKLELTPKGYTQLQGYQFSLVAGMPAEVMIKTEERTILSYLIKPFFDMLNRSFNEE
jgi:epimerase transport system membrane fusion protein